MRNKALSLLTTITFYSFTVTAQVQVSKEPRHKNVLENKYIRLLDVWINPGDTTLFHIHSTPSLFLQFTSTVVCVQIKGAAWIKSKNKEGNASYRSFVNDTLVHRVSNCDTIPFHVTDIELLSSWKPNTPLQSLPFTVLFDNERAVAYKLTQSSFSNQIISNQGPIVAQLVSGDEVMYYDSKKKKSTPIKIIMRKFLKPVFYILTVTICFCNAATAQSETIFDIVLTGGRVIDPETKLDTIKNVGILNNRIAQISSEPLKGKEMISVAGLVVAPGFIDLHVHGRTNKEQEYQLHDGVTTGLELEWGIEFLDKWYASRKGKALINYGASVSWPFERFRGFANYKKEEDELSQAMTNGESNFETLLNKLKPASTLSLTQTQINKTLEYIKQSLADGGIGIGVPIAYVPCAKPEEVFRVYQMAASLQALIYTHVREGGIMAVQQVIADAILTGASVHINHINSSTLSQISLAIELVQTAQLKGYNITTELYPYPAASTGLQSALFDEGWQQRLGISYGDLLWVATGERLTKETFENYRKIGGIVIIYSMKQEWIKAGVAANGTIIASDGMPYAKLAHPRTAGTFSRVLGKYVREEKVLSLSEAIEKMTLLPAKRLESIAPMMRFKGRLQIGSDADITIFNPDIIIDKATFEKGLEFSAGIEYVLVNGTFVLKNGKTVSNVFPGQPVYGKYKK